MAGRFDGGVTCYTRGVATIPVGFPEDAVCCRYCPYLRADAAGARHKCIITEHVIYGLDWRPDDCPVEIKEVDEHG